MLRIEDLQVFYDAIQALKGISFGVEEKTVTALIGNNGAGKSTTLNTISGLVKPKKGRIFFQDKDITRLKPHEIVALGIIQAPEGRRLFPEMTIRENLEMGAFIKNDPGYIRNKLEEVYALFTILRVRERNKAWTLSGGQQQMLTLGRALMGDPKLLMLDEPSLGLAPLLVKQIFEYIIKIRERGVTILLIEQNAKAALKIADRAYVLETGNIVLEGTGKELLENPQVQRSYLGVK